MHVCTTQRYDTLLYFIINQKITIQSKPIGDKSSFPGGGIEPTNTPLLTACESVSNTSTPDPSLMTKPPRFRSKGRDASVGLSLKAVFIAIKLQKPAKLSGVSGASVPPTPCKTSYYVRTIGRTLTQVSNLR